MKTRNTLNWIGIGVGLLPSLWFLYEGVNGYALGHRVEAVPSLVTGAAVVAFVVVARLWRTIGPTLMIAAGLVAPFLDGAGARAQTFGLPEAFDGITFVYVSLPLMAAAVIFFTAAAVPATGSGKADTRQATLNSAGLAIAVLPAGLLWVFLVLTPTRPLVPVGDWESAFVDMGFFAGLLLMSRFWRPHGTLFALALSILLTLAGLVDASSARWIEQDARYDEIASGLLPVFLATLPLLAASLLFLKAHRLEHPRQGPPTPVSPTSARGYRVAAAALSGLGIAIGVFAVFAWVYPLIDLGMTSEWLGAAYCFGVGFGFLALVVIGRLGSWIGPTIVVAVGVALLLATSYVELGLPLVVVGIFFLGAWSFRERLRDA